MQLPRILIVDDLFGRAGPNPERANLCRQFLLRDVTPDASDPPPIPNPVAAAVFHRGQRPARAGVGDVVENDLQGTLDALRQGWNDVAPSSWSLVLLDLCFRTGELTEESDQDCPGMPQGRDGDDDSSRYFGLTLLREIHRGFPDLPVVILSSMPREDVSREFAAHGALGFLPRNADGAAGLLRDFIEKHGLIPDREGRIAGRSKSLLIALRAARRAAATRMNVLIRGERGTGKELLAEYIHRNAARPDAPFVVVNSAALVETLFEGELFGIERGVATDVRVRQGLIVQADGGDLFFDEIKDMSPSGQAKILRVVQDRMVAPVGGKPRKVDVRFLSATNADIETMSASEAFRADLLDRLREGGTVHIPPLRDRREDIPEIVEKLVRDAEHAVPGAMRRETDPAALAKLQGHDWPGNVRELETCVRRAVAENPDVEHLVPAHLRIDTRATPDSGAAPVLGPRDARLGAGWQELRREMAAQAAQCIKEAALATRRTTPSEREGKIEFTPTVGFMLGCRITTTEARRELSRFLKFFPELEELMLADPVLKVLYEIGTGRRTSGVDEEDRR